MNTTRNARRGIPSDVTKKNRSLHWPAARKFGVIPCSLPRHPRL